MLVLYVHVCLFICLHDNIIIYDKYICVRITFSAVRYM